MAAFAAAFAAFAAAFAEAFVVGVAAAAAAVLVPAAAATAAPAAPAVPEETTTQFPNPPAEVNETKHKFPAFPPVQVVPAGIWTVSCTFPVVVGANTPFFVTVAALNAVPFPVASTWAVNWVEPSFPALKLVAVTVKLLPLRGTAVDVSIAVSAALPQGLAVLGRWTFARARVPVTPSAGETPAWPRTVVETAARTSKVLAKNMIDK